MHRDRNPVTDFRIHMYTPFHPVLKLDQNFVLFDTGTNYCVPVDTVLPKPWYICTKLHGIIFYKTALFISMM